MTSHIVCASGFTINGKVIDDKKGHPIEMVVVKLIGEDMWTTTNKKGEFTFKSISEGEYIIELSFLGYVTIKNKIKVTASGNYVFKMEEQSLGLDEIVVTAKENTDIGTSSRIEQTALEYIQPTNLGDVIQLMPGMESTDPDMSKPSQIKLRELDDDANASFGTAVIVDGSSISNDANMQQLSTLKENSDLSITKLSTANSGADMRSVSTNNIESVDIVRGIASAEYGDMTSGAVIVKTKAGVSPWYFEAKTDHKMSQFSLDKGFGLDIIPGAFNINADYMHSNPSMMFPNKSFERFTGGVAYSNTFMQSTTPLRFNLKLSGYRTTDHYKTDPDWDRDEKAKIDNKGVKINMYGSYQLRKPYITSLRYNFNLNYDDQNSYQNKLVSLGDFSLPLSDEDGMHAGIWKDKPYYSEFNIYGKPLKFSSKLVYSLISRFGKVNNSFLLGSEWRYQKNYGDGKIIDRNAPPTSGATGLRPKPFHETPSLRKNSLFVENKLTIPLRTTKLTLQTGLRHEHLLMGDNNMSIIDPRINLKYQLFNKHNSLFRDISVKYGFGIQSKSPSMRYLDPDDLYLDIANINRPGSTPYYTTKYYKEILNPELKYSRNYKNEIGVDIKYRKMSLSITAYKEELYDGYGFRQQIIRENYKKVITDGLQKEDVVEKDESDKFYYNDGGNRVYLPLKNEIYIDKGLLVPDNNYRNSKMGIEYTLKLGKVKPIKTAIVIDGAWMHSYTYNEKPEYKQPAVTVMGEEVKWYAVFESNVHTKRERFNSRFRFITHIPEIKLVFTTTMNVIWMDKKQYYRRDNDRNDVAYYYDDKGIKHTGSAVLTDTKYKKAVNPDYYLDEKGERHEFLEEHEKHPVLGKMVKHFKNEKSFMEAEWPMLFVMNLKVKKQITSNMDISLFVNNLLFYRPDQNDGKVATDQIKNNPIYVGGSLKFKF